MMVAGEPQFLPAFPPSPEPGAGENPQAASSAGNAHNDRHVSKSGGWRGPSIGALKGSGLKLLKTVGRTVGGKSGKHHKAPHEEPALEDSHGSASAEAHAVGEGEDDAEGAAQLQKALGGKEGAGKGTWRGTIRSCITGGSTNSCENPPVTGDMQNVEDVAGSGYTGKEGETIAAGEAKTVAEGMTVGGAGAGEASREDTVSGAVDAPVLPRDISMDTSFPAVAAPRTAATMQEGDASAAQAASSSTGSSSAGRLSPLLPSLPASSSLASLSHGTCSPSHTGEMTGRRSPRHTDELARSSAAGSPMNSREMNSREMNSREMKHSQMNSREMQPSPKHTGEMRRSPLSTGELNARSPMNTGELSATSASMGTNGSPHTPAVSRTNSARTRGASVSSSPYMSPKRGGMGNAEMFAFCPLAAGSASGRAHLRSSRSFSGSSSGPLTALKPLRLPALMEAVEEGDEEGIRAAVEDIRLALKGSSQNKERLVSEGGVPVLVDLTANSNDKETVEHAVTALYNISRMDSGRAAIFDTPGGAQSLVVALLSESEEARENAAAAVFCLFAPNSVKTGASGRRGERRGEGSGRGGSMGESMGESRGEEGGRSWRGVPGGSGNSSPSSSYMELPANSPVSLHHTIGGSRATGSSGLGFSLLRGGGRSPAAASTGISGSNSSSAVSLKGGASVVGVNPESLSEEHANTEVLRRGGSVGSIELGGGVGGGRRGVEDLTDDLLGSGGATGGSSKEIVEEAVTTSSIGSVEGSAGILLQSSVSYGSSGSQEERGSTERQRGGGIGGGNGGGGGEGKEQGIPGLPPRSGSIKGGDSSPMVGPRRGGGGLDSAAIGPSVDLKALKEAVCEVGAIPALVTIMKGGSARGRRDAMLALYVLLHGTERAEEFVQLGGVEHCLDCLKEESENDETLTTAPDPAMPPPPVNENSLEEKAMALVAVSADCQAGREAILGHSEGMQILVDGLEAPIQRVREDAVRVLLRLASNDEGAREQVVEEGIVVPLKRLVQVGSRRAVSDAQVLLQLLGSL